MNILEKICLDKKKHVENKKNTIDISKLKSYINIKNQSLGFINQIKTSDGYSLIAEVKKASPSKGIIRENFNHIEIAKIYEKNGASCVSVLTDEPYFQGKDQYLIDIKKSIHIPVLRKDFIIDEYQIWESKALGADCILLIMAALTDDEVKNFYDLTNELGMDTLFEIHNEEELERCLKLCPEMVGVNSRNLKTLEVSIQTSIDLVNKIPNHIIKVAESGLKTHNDIERLYNLGYKAFLIGESLTKKENIAEAIKEILNQT